MSDDQIAERINEMGYATCRPRQIAPCHYKVNDGMGTILRVLIVVNHLTPSTSHAQIFDVDSTVQVSAFVPASSRAPEKLVPYTAAEMTSGIVVHDVDYDILRGGFSTHSMSDGMVVSVKAAMGQIDKTKFVTPHGEPVYIVNPFPVTKIQRGDGRAVRV